MFVFALSWIKGKLVAEADRAETIKVKGVRINLRNVSL